MKRILIGSPVRQKSIILKEFLSGLDEADKGDNQISYFFVDDNMGDESSLMLKSFADTHDTILKVGSDLFHSSNSAAGENYDGHRWKSENLAKVTLYKNEMIRYCIDEKFDYLFLIDSDIVIDKRTIPHLISRNVEIVSNIFWSQWQKNGWLTPQCFWIPDIYTQFKEFNVPITGEEANQIRLDTYEKLKVPGIYKVDGLGACTMIARSALEKGVSFKEIPNLAIPGEDRAFCIRAGVHGIDLYMDSVYPAYHIVKEEFLSRLDEYKKEGFKYDMCQTFEEEPKKKNNIIKKFLYRLGRKLVRDFSV